MADFSRIEDLANATAYDVNGDKVGAVKDVYVNDTTGQPDFISVKHGIFGSGDSIVPLRGHTLRDRELHLAFPKERIEDAPDLDENGHLTGDDQDALYRHYGLTDTKDVTTYETPGRHAAPAAGTAGTAGAGLGTAAGAAGAAAAGAAAGTGHAAAKERESFGDVLRDKAGAFRHKVEDAGDALRDKAGDAGEALRDTAGDVRDKVGDAGHSLRDKAEDAGDALRDKAGAFRDKAGDAGEAVRDKAGDAGEAVRDKAGDAGDALRDTAGNVRDKAGDAGDALRDKADDVRDNLTGKDELAATSSAAQLNAATDSVEPGQVHLRKYVVNENETVEVPVERDDVRVVREPLTGTERVSKTDDTTKGCTCSCHQNDLDK